MPAARDEDWTAIAAQAAAGATLEELSAHWNIPVGTLKDRCAAGGWKRHAREIQAQKAGVDVVSPGHGNVQPRPTQRAVSLMETLSDRNKIRGAKVGGRILNAIGRRKDERLANSGPQYKATVEGLATVHDWGKGAQGNAALVNINLLGTIVPDAP